MCWANDPDRLEAGPTGGTGFQPVAVRWEEPPSVGGVSKGVYYRPSNAAGRLSLNAFTASAWSRVR